MSTTGPAGIPGPEDGGAPTSKMRSHKGNQPVLPQDKQCPHCSAKFTRTTHLNRHMRNHTKEGLHTCELCGAEFTRSDLLSRHMKTCVEKQGASRRKSCISCTESKVKCDREMPCLKCSAKGKDCIYPANRRRASRIDSAQNPSQSNPIILAPNSFPPPLPPGPGGVIPILNIASHAAPHPHPDHSTFPFDPALPGGGSAYSSAQSEAVGNTEVNPEQSSRYQNDVFQPFFASLFGNSDSPSSEPSPSNPISSENFPFATSILDTGPFNPSGSRYFSADLHPGSSLPLSNIRGSPTHSTASLSSESNSSSPETDYYVHLFFTEYLKQMPIAHEGTFRHAQKPPVLLSVMAACGALFVRTRVAADFIAKTLSEARDPLFQAFAKSSLDHVEQVHLILAVGLLQTIGLFHQSGAERASSNIYHGMVVMMVRRTGLIDRMAAWQPETPNTSNLDSCWRSWALHEMTKRCLWLSYLHDTCHAIYFALECSYNPEEMCRVKLPCENSLFFAKTATDWFRALQNPSPYGSVQYRLTNIPMVDAYESLASRDVISTPSPIPPFGHFILSHRILRRQFEICVEISRLPGPNQSPPEMLGLQYRLHNWLQGWLRCPDIPAVKPNERRQEPPFFDNALTFYWLGQIVVLAFQDGHPPFTSACPSNREGEARFALIKRWLKRIRQWLESTDEAPTVFWDDLMKLRLKAWQAEPLSEEQDQGLLGFFPVNP